MPHLVDLTRAWADARTLGVGAVPRGIYEASKRLGGHRLLFGTAIAAPTAGRHVTELTRIGLPVPPDLSEPGLRVAADAADAAKGLVPVFGHRVDLGPQIDWHAALDGAGRWPHQPWWQIDIRSDARRGDVKWIWELGRMRHLVVLARAAALTGDPAALDRLRRDLDSWFIQNPPEVGIHWYSNLEVALRAFALVQVHELVEQLLGAELREKIGATIAHSARHIIADLPYTVSSMRNNHWLGDSLGLLVIDRLRRGGSAGAAGHRPARHLARRLFDHQLRRQVRDDGSMIEDSVSYHRFVLEMLVVRLLVDPTEQVRAALLRAAQFLCRLGALDGPVPQYGDWDEGRILVSSGNPLELAGSVAAALSAAGSGAPADWRAAYDECAWYLPPGTAVPAESTEVDGHDVGGGIARSRRGRWTSWLKAGSGPSHGHADLCSSSVLYGTSWVVVDPGTGTYNGPLTQRNVLRTTAAHSALRLGGEDQLVPHRAFRWRHTAIGRIGAPWVVGDAVVSWGFHTAYRRLHPPRRVVRLVITDPHGVAFVDYVEGPPGLAWELTIPFASEVEVDEAAATAVLPGGEALRLTLPTQPTRLQGSTEPWGGWHSRTYGSLEPASWLLLTGRVDGPVLWALHEAADPPVRLDGDDLVVSGMVLRPVWEDGQVTLGARGRA